MCIKGLLGIPQQLNKIYIIDYIAVKYLSNIAFNRNSSNDAPILITCWLSSGNN